MRLLFLIVLCSVIKLLYAISCYSCTFDFNQVYDLSDGWCVNDTLYDKPKNEVIRPCAPWEKECSVRRRDSEALYVINSYGGNKPFFCK